MVVEHRPLQKFLGKTVFTDGTAPEENSILLTPITASVSVSFKLYYAKMHHTLIPQGLGSLWQFTSSIILFPI